MNEQIKKDILRIIDEYIYIKDYVELKKLLKSNKLNEARLIISKYHDLYSGEIDKYKKNEQFFKQIDKAYDLILELIFETPEVPLFL